MIFGISKKQRISKGLLEINEHPDLLKSFTALQNEIGVGFDMKTLAVTSVHSDTLAASFAKAFADTFANNGSSALIIDANLYDPCLSKSLNLPQEQEPKVHALSEKVGILSLSSEIYPSRIFREGEIAKIIEENRGDYDHVVILVPALREHKEVALLGNVIDSLVLVTQRNVTQKKDIYEACCFLAENKLPLAKVVVLK